MTTQLTQTPQTPDAVTDAVPPPRQRLLALSGVAFAALFVVGWFTTGGVTPHYTAPDQDWTNWARDNQWNGRISGFLMLLAGFVFLYFMAGIRSVLGSAESPGSGSAQLARVAFGGALTGMAGIAMASVTLAAASSNGADANPVVSKAVATASGGPFLVAAMGFAAFLMAAGLLTLRTGVFRTLDRHRGADRSGLLPHHVLDRHRRNDGRQRLGYAFFPAIVSLVIWTVVTSVASYRAVAS
jgi:hypothetical protein